MNQDLIERRPRLMNTGEVAKYLRVSRSLIYRMAREGQIPALKVGRKWLFRKETIEQWLSEREDLPIHEGGNEDHH
ncbi:MAG: helix-turn-helix domain-containing protein [Chloroflexota bacterium]|nr:helix-turn-helix domain-containing protein [Chloroflexota bacterium]